jgi:hypothetical protein
MYHDRTQCQKTRSRYADWKDFLVRLCLSVDWDCEHHRTEQLPSLRRSLLPVLTSAHHCSTPADLWRCSTFQGRRIEFIWQDPTFTWIWILFKIRAGETRCTRQPMASKFRFQQKEISGTRNFENLGISGRSTFLIRIESPCRKGRPAHDETFDNPFERHFHRGIVGVAFARGSYRRA